MGQMKNYKQLIKELPSKKVVFAFGRFNPPTTGHELLVKMVKKIASTQGADHVIYASKTQDSKKNPLSVDKKVSYLNLMFHGTHFVAADNEVRTFVEAAKKLNKKYKNIIMIAGSDRVEEYKKILNKYNGSEFNFDTIQVVSAGERDPDADDASGMSGTKMRSLASKGDFAGFKKGLPSSIREIDARRLMNDIRQGMGLDILKEQVKFTVDQLREQYYRGEIYLVGQFVESNDERYEILDRGSNYLVLVDSTGNTSKKWIKDVMLSQNQVKEDISIGPAPEQITFKGYTTKNFNRTADAAKAFQDTISRTSEKDPVAVLNALKATDTYMGLNDRHIAGEDLTDDEIQEWNTAREKAKESLERVGEFMHHEDYWHMHGHELEGLLTNFKETGKGELQDSAENEGTMIPEELTDKTLRPNDKIKVARIIATMLGLDKVEGSSNAETLVNSALRRIKSKALNAEGYAILQKMLALATEVGIEYDNGLVPAKLKEEGPTVVPFNKKKDNNIAGDIAQPDDVNKINKPGHSFGAETDTHRKMKVKHVTEATKQSALDKWRAGANDRLKKQADDEAEYKAKKANFETEFKKWQKEVHGDKLKEETVDESFVDGHWGAVGSDKNYDAKGKKYGSPTAAGVKRIVKKLETEKPADGSIYKKQSKSERDKYVSNQLKSLKHIGEETLEELSNDLLARYKKKAGAESLAADKVGDIKKADKRFSGVMKATKKQFQNDVKNRFKEEVDLEEAHKLGDQVEIVKGSSKGIKGHIGEIRHGAFKGAPKTFTVFHGEHGAVQVGKEHIRKLKESRNQADKHWDEAEAHKAEAEKHKNSADKSTYHMHMANHHEAMSRYHSDIGEHTAAQKHADKADDHYNKGNGFGEEFELAEAVDKKQQLRDALRRHEQKAIEANRAGDDEKTKLHQQYMNKIKDKMEKLVRNEEVELEEGTFKYHMDKAISAKERGDEKKTKYHLDNARTARYTLKSTEVGKHKDLLDKYKQMTEEVACPACGMSPCGCDHTEMNDQNLEDQLMAELDLTDEQIDHIVDSVQEDDFIDAYDDDELAVIDADTGEEIEDDETVNEEALMEVLSRAQRMRAKVRFAKTKSKRERRAMIAAKTHATTKVVNKRARRMAIKLIKNRLLRGRDISKLSVGEKERIERVIQKRKAVIGRIAMKLTPKVRAIEKARLSHSKYTKGTPNVAF